MAVGQSLLRREDPRLLRGRGQYVSDMQAPGMLHAGFLRSSHARARILATDLSAAKLMPGIITALTGADLAALPNMFDSSNSSTEQWLRRVQPRMQTPRARPLADGEVYYAGQAVAVVVGESRYEVEDALEAIEVEYEPLEPVLDAGEAAKPGATKVHTDLDDNLLFEFHLTKGDPQRAFEQAPKRVSQRLRCGRNTAAPMEGRGVLAVPDAHGTALIVHSGTQTPHTYRRVMAQMLGLPEHLVRVIAADTGGGFGGKNGIYPEDVVVAYLARLLDRPVKWLADRREDLQTMIHSRDQVFDATVAFEPDGRIVAVRVEQWLDAGAYQPMGPVVPYQVFTHLLGPYAIEHLDFHGRAVATNKTPSAPYRGAGRPEATYVMETLVDLVARDTGLDPAEVRRRNLVSTTDMPYRVGIPFRDGGDVVYDSGDYPALLRLALGDEYAGWRDAQRTPPAGKRIGIGLACYVEATGTGPFEGASVTLDASGQLTLATGGCSQGQGHEVSLAQVIAELWDAEPDRVAVLLGDTGRIAYGAGTYASRTLQLVSAAAHEASAQLQAHVRQLAAQALEARADDLEIDLARREVVVRGSAHRALPLAQIARMASPGWRNAGVVSSPSSAAAGEGRVRAPAGSDDRTLDGRRPLSDPLPAAEGTTSVAVGPGLQATAYFAPNAPAWAAAAHVAVVEVDAETAALEVKRYVVAHDAGTIVNPLLADGQVVGGVVTGLGGALTEEVVYDDAGQPLTTSLMDYLVPTSMEAPAMEVRHQETPSPLNPLGIKGLGEGGTVGAPAAIANAVADALGVPAAELPLTPERVFRLLASSKAR